MVLRLSELLERIRPAGTPGPALEHGESRRRARLDQELADVAPLLADFERDADRLRDAAAAEADGLRRDAERRARQIRSGLPERIAVARAQTSEALDRASHDEQDEIAQETERTLSRLRRSADEGRAALVDEVVDTIWAGITDDTDTHDRPAMLTAGSSGGGDPG